MLWGHKLLHRLIHLHSGSSISFRFVLTLEGHCFTPVNLRADDYLLQLRNLEVSSFLFTITSTVSESTLGLEFPHTLLQMKSIPLGTVSIAVFYDLPLFLAKAFVPL